MLGIKVQLFTLNKPPPSCWHSHSVNRINHSQKSHSSLPIIRTPLSHLPYIDHIATEGKGGYEKAGTRLTYERIQSAERHWEPIPTWATHSKQSMCRDIGGGAGGFESDLQRSTTPVSCALEQQLSAQLPSPLPASGEPFSLFSTNCLCFYYYPHTPSKGLF